MLLHPIQSWVLECPGGLSGWSLEQEAPGLKWAMQGLLTEQEEVGNTEGPAAGGQSGGW